MDLPPGRIEAAGDQIDPVFLDTPQLVSDRLSEESGREVVVKFETLNPIGSFKGRGTSLLAAQLDPGDTWVCETAGNFGQGLAYAGRSREAAVQIFVGRNAPDGKVARMRALGAEVEVSEHPHSAAREYAAADEGRYLVVDGVEPAGAAGVAALNRHPGSLVGERVAVLLTGAAA